MCINIKQLRDGSLREKQFEFTVDISDVEPTVSSPVTVAPCADRALSLFAFGGPVRGLSIHGASYELNGYELQPDDPLCVSNHTTDAPCEISFSEGTLLLFLSKD